MKRVIYATQLMKGHEHLAIIRAQKEIHRAEHYALKLVVNNDR